MKQQVLSLWFCAVGLFAQVQTGADQLAKSNCALLHGRKLGLITNHTGVLRDGRRVVDVLAACQDLQVVALFSPEHGWQGQLDEQVGDTRDARTGLVVHSLYGATRKPTPAMLQGLDTLVFDIQDIGCRFYTYLATMRYAMEAAAESGLRFVVLDRPNPLGGRQVAGPVCQAEARDFVASHTIALQHGMTAGELARMMAGENGIRLDLQVLACQGWQRADRFDRTGIPWINPSPNMRSLMQALLYPGVGLLEGTNLSVGRGTDAPFELLGAPWCDGPRLAALLREQQLAGLAVLPVQFTPSSSKYQGEVCSGVRLAITDWDRFDAPRLGIALACALQTLHAKAWSTTKLNWLLKHDASAAAITAGKPMGEIVALWQKDLELFKLRRKAFLLYE